MAAARKHRRDVILACGHQERVVSRAMGLLDLPEAPLLLEFIRLQTWGSAQHRRFPVYSDLMIHDLDLALDAERRRAAGGGGPAHAPPKDPFIDDGAGRDHALGDWLVYANCSASRIAEDRERRMRIVLPSGEVRVDFIARTFVNTTPFDLNPGFADTPAGRDPLGASVAASFPRGRARTRKRAPPVQPAKRPPAPSIWPWRWSRRRRAEAAPQAGCGAGRPLRL